MFAGRPGRGRQPKPPPDPHARIVELVTLACESGGSAPDPELLRALKREVRADAVALRRAHDTLMDRCLRHRECGPRLHAVVIVDELFRRSRDFRDAHMERLDAFLRRAIVGRDDSGADPAEAIPGPVEDADRLVSRACGALQEWNERFGAHYPRLGVALRFVDDVLGPAAPASIAERESRRRKNAKTRTEPGVSFDGDVANGNDCRGCAGTRGSTRWPSGSASRSSSARSRSTRISKTMNANGTRPTETTKTTTKDGKTSTRTNPTSRPGARYRPDGAQLAGDVHGAQLAGDVHGAQLAGDVRVAVTDDNRVVVDELRRLCRAATVRVLPGLAEALALVAGIHSIPVDRSTPSGGRADRLGE